MLGLQANTPQKTWKLRVLAGRAIEKDALHAFDVQHCPASQSQSSAAGWDHMPGVKRWLHAGPRGDEEALQQPGSPPAEGPHDAGVRRALLRSCLALCCSPEVLQASCSTVSP